MKKAIFLILIILTLSACSSSTEVSNNNFEKADRLEIINFHSSYQCYACNYIGDNIFEIIDRNFRNEYQSGKIVFKKINVDKSENKDLVDKYQARGSSLFFNAIYKDKDNISEDVNIWRMVGNDQSFELYIVRKINEILYD